MSRDRSDDGARESETADGTDDDIGPSIPKVQTEDAGSGLFADLKSDNELDTLDIPGVIEGESTEPETDVTTKFEDVDFSEVSDDLLETFVALVLIINAAVLAVSLGALFLIFEGATDYGVPLLLIGVVLFGFGFRRYRNYKHSHEQADDEVDAATTATPDDTGEKPSSEVPEQGVPDEPDSP
ncbi:hypothetical protein [Natronolimnobius sp. AArcel1]|uniref:DUF7322 domain-containing protein n=1 Tax=Natronolimnobius sp. AArcel1 TaxID=1679093 RepID=UPI0031B69A8B